MSESEPVSGFVLSRARFSPLSLSLSLSFSLALSGAWMGAKDVKIQRFFCLQGARSAEWSGRRWVVRGGEQKNRRIRKESVADCFGPFMRRSFWPFLG